MRAADDTFSAEQDTPLLIPLADLTANDQLNPGSDAIVVSRDPSVGQLVASPDGFLNYVSPGRFVGTVNFVYWLEDGPERSNVATVTITVRSTDLDNRPPVANLDGYFHTSYSSDTGGTVVVDAAHGVLASDTDADGDVLAAFLYQGQERLLLAPHLTAWAGILAEWRSARFNQRVDNLRDGSGTPTRANGGFFRRDATVNDDAAVTVDVPFGESLFGAFFGSSGNDWFLYQAGDVVRDLATLEQAKALNTIT